MTSQIADSTGQRANLQSFVMTDQWNCRFFDLCRFHNYGYPVLYIYFYYKVIELKCSGTSSFKI